MRRDLRRLLLIGLLLGLTPLRPVRAEWFDLPEPAKREGRLQALLAQVLKKPGEGAAHYELGLLHLFHKNDLAAAVRHLSQAAELQEHPAAALYFMGAAQALRVEQENLLRTSLDLLRLDPKGPFGQLAAQRIESLFGSVRGYNSLVTPCFEELFRRSDIQGLELREHLRITLANIYIDEGRSGDADAMHAEAGFIEDWLMAGPFGRFDYLGFDTAFLPEIEDAPQKIYASARGDIPLQAMNFHRERVFPRGSRGRLPEGRAGGTFYALTFLNCPKDVSAILRINSAGPIKVFVNNHLVLERDRIRLWLGTTDYFGVELREGWNKVTVKFTSQQRPGAFTLRLLDKTGRPLRVETRTTFDSYPSLKGAPPPNTFEVRLPAGDYFSKALRAAPSAPLLLALNSRLAIQAGDYQAAKSLLKRAAGSLPECAYVNYLLGQALRNDMTVMESIRRQRARLCFQKAVDVAPSAVACEYQLAQLDREEGKPLEAIARLRKGARAAPAWPKWHEALFDAYLSQKWYKEAEDALSEAITLAPEQSSPFRAALEYFRSADLFAQYEAASHTLQKRHADGPYLARFLRHAHRFEEADSALAAAAQRSPMNESYRRELALLHLGRGKWADAERELTQLLTWGDDTGPLWRDLAEAQFLQGNASSANAVLMQAARHEPENLSQRRAAILAGTPDPIEPYVVRLEQVLADKRNYDLPHPGSSAAMLLDQAIVHIAPDGSTRERVHIVGKAYDKRGVQRWGEVRIPPGAEIIELRTIKADGTVVEPELLTQKTAISMTGLGPGDMVEYEYVRARPSREQLPGGYAGEAFYFQNGAMPIEHAQFVVIAPATWQLRILSRQGAPLVKSEPRGEWKALVWEARGVRSAGEEPGAPHPSEILPCVRVARGVTWEDVSRNFANMLADELRPTLEMEDALVAAGARGVDERRAAQAMFAYVNKEVRDLSGGTELNRDASATLAEKRGNRLVLLKALLDMLKIRSEVFMVNRPVDAAVLADFPDPSPGAFRYALLRVTFRDGQAVWLDTGLRHSTFGHIPPFAQDANALPATAMGPAAFVRTPKLSPEEDMTETTFELHVDAEGRLRGRGVETYRGVTAATMKEAYGSLPVNTRRQHTQQRLNQYFAGSTLEDLEAEGLDQVGGPMVQRYSFSGGSFARKEATELVFGLGVPPLSLSRAYLGLRKRQFPLLIGSPVYVTTTATVHFPDQLKLASLAPGAQVTSAFGTYSLEIEQSPGAVRVKRKIVLPITRIPPTDYGKFIEFCERVDAAERGEFKAGP